MISVLIEDFEDRICYRIFRNVMLAFYAVPAFADDVTATATKHANSRDDLYGHDLKVRLSIGYILEEIALSLRIHLVDGVGAEFYMGSHSVPVLKLYAGQYEFRASDLVEGAADVRVAFYEMGDGMDFRHWLAV